MGWGGGVWQGEVRKFVERGCSNDHLLFVLNRTDFATKCVNTQGVALPVGVDVVDDGVRRQVLSAAVSQG